MTLLTVIAPLSAEEERLMTTRFADQTPPQQQTTGDPTVAIAAKIINALLPWGYTPPRSLKSNDATKATQRRKRNRLDRLRKIERAYIELLEAAEKAEDWMVLVEKHIQDTMVFKRERFEVQTQIEIAKKLLVDHQSAVASSAESSAADGPQS